MIPRFAIILTHDRPELLKQCVDAIAPQVNKIYVIDNASDPPVEKGSFDTAKASVVHVPDQPPNLSMLWNIGIDFAGAAAAYLEGPYRAYDVAFLCDDVMAPEGWFDTVSEHMRRFNAAAASTHQYSPVPVPLLKQAPDSDIYNRMCGWAFMVRGELQQRADETLKWWWCDTDMDFQARKNGGTVICPGPVAKNIHPNDFTYRVPGLVEQTGLDGETFAAKWGGRPW